MSNSNTSSTSRSPPVSSTVNCGGGASITASRRSRTLRSPPSRWPRSGPGCRPGRSTKSRGPRWRPCSNSVPSWARDRPCANSSRQSCRPMVMPYACAPRATKTWKQPSVCRWNSTMRRCWPTCSWLQYRSWALPDARSWRPLSPPWRPIPSCRATIFVPLGNVLLLWPRLHNG